MKHDPRLMYLPVHSQGKKQSNIIEDKKPEMLKRMKEQQLLQGGKGGGPGSQGGPSRKFAPNAGKVHGEQPKAKKEAADLSDVPRALHSFFKKA